MSSPPAADAISFVVASGQANAVEPAAAPAPVARMTAPQAAGYWASQKLIRTASLRIQVKDVTAALKRVDTIARAHESLLADTKVTQDAEATNVAQVMLRIPTQRFGEVVAALTEIGTVRDEAVGTQDITKEYADLETRLGVKQQTVARLRTLLDSHTAKLTDVLQVEQELAREITELEQLKGERRYYDQQISLSTVTLSLFERAPTHIAQLSNPITDALRSSLQVLGTSIGTIIYVLVAVTPWVVLTLLVVWFVKPLRQKLLRN